MGKTDVQWVKTKLGHLYEGPGSVNPGPLDWCYPCSGLEFEGVYGYCCCYFGREEILQSKTSYIEVILEGFGV